MQLPRHRVAVSFNPSGAHSEGHGDAEPPAPGPDPGVGREGGPGAVLRAQVEQKGAVTGDEGVAAPWGQGGCSPEPIKDEAMPSPALSYKLPVWFLAQRIPGGGEEGGR